MHSLMVIFINLNMEFKNKALGRWLHLRVEISCLNTGDFLGRALALGMQCVAPLRDSANAGSINLQERKSDNLFFIVTQP